MSQWDFQNKGKSGWTDKSSFVLEVPLRHLRPSVIYSLPCDRILQRAYIVFYYMASSGAGKMTQIARCDWLPKRARWSHLARSGLPAVSRKKNFPESHIINPLLTKFVRSRWLDIGLVLFFASLLTSTSSRSTNTQKKNLANIQPSWPHTWSVTHTYSHFIWLNGSMSLIRAETEGCDIAGFSKVTTY